MRVRIIVEIVLNSETFHSQEYFQKGLFCTPSINLAKSFAMYSEEYIPAENNSLGRSEIKLIFEKEILKITKKQLIWEYGSFSKCFREINLRYLSKAWESIRKKNSQQTYFTPSRDTQDCVHHVDKYPF